MGNYTVQPSAWLLNLPRTDAKWLAWYIVVGKMGGELVYVHGSPDTVYSTQTTSSLCQRAQAVLAPRMHVLVTSSGSCTCDGSLDDERALWLKLKHTYTFTV